ncbi:MAG: DUF1801 domain-containing protein [Candidatus Kapabacteria bacterium]|nr:DUF1801 domain-containing protein [Candidatus Kapabacteria bacterium]
MTQSDDQNSAQSQSSSPHEGGSADGEGRNRRRRRRGGGGGGRRPEGQPREQRENEPASDDRPSIRHSDTRTDRPAETQTDPQPNRQPMRADDGPADADAQGADADRKRKRRRNKKKPGAAGDANQQQEQRSGSDAQTQQSQQSQQQQQQNAQQQNPQQQNPQQPQQQQQSNPRGRQGDRKPQEPAEKKERAPRGSVLQRRVTRGEYNDVPVQKEETVVSAPINAINVEAYIAHHKGWQREVLTTIRSIILSAGGQIDESILWSQPVYSANGPVCYLKAFTDHVNFGFWRGTELDDPESLLVGDMTKMRHVTLQSTNDIKRDLFESMVRQAVRLNRDKGDPTLS